MEGDAARVLKSLVGPVDFLFLDNDFGNYSGSFDAIEPRLSEGATVVADNAGIGAVAMEITEFRPRGPSCRALRGCPAGTRGVSCRKLGGGSPATGGVS